MNTAVLALAAILAVVAAILIGVGWVTVKGVGSFIKAGRRQQLVVVLQFLMHLYCWRYLGLGVRSHLFSLTLLDMGQRAGGRIAKRLIRIRKKRGRSTGYNFRNLSARRSSIALGYGLYVFYLLYSTSAFHRLTDMLSSQEPGVCEGDQ